MVGWLAGGLVGCDPVHVQNASTPGGFSRRQETPGDARRPPQTFSGARSACRRPQAPGGAAGRRQGVAPGGAISRQETPEGARRHQEAPGSARGCLPYAVVMSLRSHPEAVVVSLQSQPKAVVMSLRSQPCFSDLRQAGGGGKIEIQCQALLGKAVVMSLRRQPQTVVVSLQSQPKAVVMSLRSQLCFLSDLRQAGGGRTNLIPMSGYAWLCLAMLGYAWLCLTLLGSAWLFLGLCLALAKALEKRFLT